MNQISSIIKTLQRVVRLTEIIILIASLHASAGTIAQERITINMKSAPLEKVFSEIELRSGYTVFYNTEVLKFSGPVTVEMKDATISDVMKQCLKGLPLEFNIQDKTIFVKHVVSHATADLAGPGKNVGTPEAGVVQTEAGQPLVGATVYIRKLKKTVMTDGKGQVMLKDVPDGEYEVEISYVGFERLTTKITVVNHEAAFTAALKQMISKLDETQVIAYGTTTKRLNTGDVTTITSSEIEEQPVSNPLAALEGRVPGLQITQTTGYPGGNFIVQIRGQNSLLNGNDPFFVVDGVPYNSEIPGSAQGYGPLNTSLNGGSPLNFINPYDIESIEVLKDADATAIYGSRAANGAILITTKKGRAGSTRVDVNLYSGNGVIPHTLDFLNTQQYLTMRHEALSNDAKTPNPNADFDLTFWDTTRYTNWQKVLFGNTAHSDDAQASVSGGSTNTQYLFGGGYHKETTPFPVLLPNEGADQKASVHFNVNNKSQNNRFKTLFTASFVSDHSTVQSSDLTYYALELPPDAPALYNPDGSLNWDPKVLGQQGTWNNPLAPLLEGYNSLTSNLVGNAIVSYLILPGLEIKGSLGYTNTQTNETQTQPTTLSDPGLHTVSGSAAFNAINTHSWIVEPQANYRLQLGKGVFSSLIGTSFHENDNSIQTMNAAGFSSDALLDNIQAASNVSVRYSNSAQYKYNAIFARLGYNWEDKYLINLNARRDGSSRFGPGRQFANFGSIAAGWIFSNENFIQKQLHFLTYGKLRASYGTTGNDQVGDYMYLDTYSPTQLPYQGIQGLYPTSLFNPDLAWEVNKKLEGAIELGFLKDRITIIANYYRNRSGNQLVTSPVSAVTGFTSIPENLPAVVQNTGQEYVVTTVNVKTKSFTWSTSLNLTIHHNKLIAYPNLASSPYAQQFVIGQPISIRKVLHCIGVNDTTGIYEFTSFKGIPTSRPNLSTDRTTLINSDPKFYGGFYNSFDYKGFRLDFLLQFVKQISTSFFGTFEQMPGKMVNQPVAVLDRWQKLGDVKPYQKFSQNQSFFSKAYLPQVYAQAYSDLGYTDASFIRLKNLSFSWQAPDNLRQKLHLQVFRVYLQGQNLLTITKYKGLDPESHSTSLPPMKVYTLGFQVGL